MSLTQTPVAPTMHPVGGPVGPDRDDLDLDFIVIQLRGTFDAKLEQLLALAPDDPRCAVHAAALDAINAALARIHDGTYGECQVCEGLISAARLEVVPTTMACVSCNGKQIA